MTVNWTEPSWANDKIWFAKPTDHWSHWWLHAKILIATWFCSVAAQMGAFPTATVTFWPLPWQSSCKGCNVCNVCGLFEAHWSSSYHWLCVFCACWQVARVQKSGLAVAALSPNKGCSRRLSDPSIMTNKAVWTCRNDNLTLIVWVWRNVFVGKMPLQWPQCRSVPIWAHRINKRTKQRQGTLTTVPSCNRFISQWSCVFGAEIG